MLILESITHFMDRHNKYFGKLTAVMRYAAMIGKHSAFGRKVKNGVRFSALFFYKRGVSMMTDYEMLSIVIMIITLVASLLINNRDK